jgi:hypothetical protein
LSTAAAAAAASDTRYASSSNFKPTIPSLPVDITLLKSPTTAFAAASSKKGISFCFFDRQPQWPFNRH